MLPSSQRLSVEQFNLVMKNGRVSHSSLFLLRLERDNLFTKALISAVAPVKVAKTAILRNKTRRRIYEAVGPIYPNLVKNIHAIVFAKSPALVADSDTFKKDLNDIFVKAGLLK